MTEFVMTVLGSELVRMLHSEAGLGREAATRFVQLQTGQPLDEGATYRVGYPAGETGAHWSKIDTLRIWKHVPDAG